MLVLALFLPFSGQAAAIDDAAVAGGVPIAAVGHLPVAAPLSIPDLDLAAPLPAPEIPDVSAAAAPLARASAPPADVAFVPVDASRSRGYGASDSKLPGETVRERVGLLAQKAAAVRSQELASDQVPFLDPKLAQTADEVIANLGTANARRLRDDTLNGKPAQRVSIHYADKPIVVFLSAPAPGAREEETLKRLESVIGDEGRFVNFSNADALENSVSINCHGYACALSGIPGFPAGWINGVSDGFSRHNPLRNVLSRYFAKIAGFKKTEESRISLDANLRPRDLVVYMRSSGEIVHSGVIVKAQRSGAFLIRSKYGAGLTLDVPVENMGMLYDYDRIGIWRRQGELL